MFTDTITLFNLLKDGYTNKIYSTVIDYVSLQIVTTYNVDKMGAIPNVNTKVYIMNDNTLPKAYLSPNLWSVNEQKDRYFTLKQGDFIAKGEVSIEDTDYQNIRNTFDNVYLIEGISYISDNILPHWELICK